jgi:LacI family transcriptional regulator
MAGLRDVARTAGVSIGTASRVVNRHPGVDPGIRARVEAAVAALGYVPNALARGLRSRKSRALGLVVPDVTNPYFAELAKHVERAAAGLGHSLILANSDNRADQERRCLQTLAGQQVDGLILVPADESFLPADLIDVPFVVVDRVPPDCAVVAADHREGGRIATAHLIGLGHVRIAHIGGPAHLILARERYEGYREALAPLTERLDRRVEDLVEREAFDYEAGYRAARRLLDRPDPPTAIFAACDPQAIGAIRAARDLGLSVPDDLSVVGFDDIPLAGLFTPRLTTVAQPIQAIGEHAVALLLDARRGGPAKRVRLPVSLRLRDTSAPPRRLSPAEREAWVAVHAENGF